MPEGSSNGQAGDFTDENMTMKDNNRAIRTLLVLMMKMRVHDECILALDDIIPLRGKKYSIKIVTSFILNRLRSKNPTPEGPALITPGRGYFTLPPEGARFELPRRC